MVAIKEFTPKDVSSSVTLSKRLNELVSILNLILDEPSKAEGKLAELEARKNRIEKIGREEATSSGRQFAGLLTLDNEELWKVAIRHDILEPKKFSKEELIDMIADRVEDYRFLEKKKRQEEAKEQIERDKKDQEKIEEANKISAKPKEKKERRKVRWGSNMEVLPSDEPVKATVNEPLKVEEKAEEPLKAEDIDIFGSEAELETLADKGD